MTGGEEREATITAKSGCDGALLRRSSVGEAVAVDGVVVDAVEAALVLTCFNGSEVAVDEGLA